MTEVPKHASLVEALAAAQGEFPPLVKDKKVEAGPRKYAYADLAAVLGVVRPVLSRHGIALIQPIEQDGEGLILHTKLCGYGETLASSFPITAPLNNPQGLGSFISYARRYSLCALVGVAADDDDDDGQEDGRKPQAPTSRDQARPMPPPPLDRMTRAALDTLEEVGRELDAAERKPRLPPDDAWLEAARLKVAYSEPDQLREWWNSEQQKRQRADLHKRRADFAPHLDELKRFAALRWWECSSLEIPPGEMGWQKWQALMARTIDAAPTVAKLDQMLQDNFDHLSELRVEVPKAGEALMAKADNARILLVDNEAPIDLPGAEDDR